MFKDYNIMLKSLKNEFSVKDLTLNSKGIVIDWINKKSKVRAKNEAKYSNRKN